MSNIQVTNIKNLSGNNIVAISSDGGNFIVKNDLIAENAVEISGIITANSSGLSISGVSTVTELVVDDVLKISGIITANSSGLSISGVSTVTELVVDDVLKISGIITANSSGLSVSGVSTATSFSGSGSSLTGIVTNIQAGANITIFESPTGNFIVTSTASGGSSAGAATTITINDESTDTACYPIFATDATGDLELKSDSSNLLYNSNTGALTANSFSGDGSNLVDGKWTLGANGTNDYTFTGIGFTQTTNDPVLYLARGNVYEFVNNSGGSHPFEIRVSNGGASYSDGVTNNGSATGTIKFEVPFNAPNTLYYQCTNHSSMGNTINVYPTTA